MGNPKRIALVAADLVAHFEKRVEAMGRQGDDRLHEYTKRHVNKTPTRAESLHRPAQPGSRLLETLTAHPARTGGPG